MHVIRLVRLLLAVLLATTGGLVANVYLASEAKADSCYTWNETLREGDTGEDVKQLQIRLAGWVSSGENLVIDGIFGQKTGDALVRFKDGYNFSNSSRVAGSGVFNKLYDLQDADCTPAHFDHSEFNYNCGARNYQGGNVSATTAKGNMIRVMWQLEAMRRKLGNHAIVITSGFRSVACNRSVGGVAGSLHTYGQAADFGTASVPSLCAMHSAAKRAGFEEILGPGYPNHSTHTHVANKSGRAWGGC